MAYLTQLSTTTIQKRSLLKSLQDEFTTFSWGGYDAFDNFGAFIINEKNGSLKFYNGPGFSNEYTKPQFDSQGGVLQGVTFNKQSISFNIGVYWISIEDYRKLLHWLNPMKIDYLQFGFNKDYRYDVKLSKIADSTRWIVGRENGEPRYYTELQLNFDIQGTPCAKGMHPYEFEGITGSGSKDWNFSGSSNVEGVCNLRLLQDHVRSDLETPVKVNFQLDLSTDFLEANYFFNETLGVLGNYDKVQDEYDLDSNYASFKQPATEEAEDPGELVLETKINNSPTEYDIELSAIYEEDTGIESVILCKMTLQDLTIFMQEGKTLMFTYNSETGLVFINTSESESGSLLSLHTYTDSGDFLVKSLFTTKFMLPGEFTYPNFYSSKLKFKLRFNKRVYEINDKGKYEWNSKKIFETAYKQPISIECFPRTNVI